MKRNLKWLLPSCSHFILFHETACFCKYQLWLPLASNFRFRRNPSNVEQFSKARQRISRNKIVTIRRWSTASNAEKTHAPCSSCVSNTWNAEVNVIGKETSQSNSRKTPATNVWHTRANCTRQKWKKHALEKVAKLEVRPYNIAYFTMNIALLKQIV